MTLRHILYLATLLTSAASCAAQAPAPPSVPSSAVPLNAWPFAAVETLRTDGIVLGYPEGTSGGRRPVTRHEFAVALARILILSVPQPITPSANLATDLPERLRKAPLAVSALIALVREFSPELSKLGQDVPQAMARLEALQRLQRQQVQEERLVLTPDRWSRLFSDVPATGWVRRDIDTAQKAGTPLGIVDDAGKGLRPVTRLQMAQSIQNTLPNSLSWLDINNNVRGDQSRVALRDLVDYLRPELTLLGANVAVYEQGLDGLGASREMTLPPFTRPLPDVPAHHWAANAVATLLKNGLLFGYPNGAYTIP